ncbi:cob(I)yrinic acid a,c-diamide adenosyltransferase [Sneathiella sp. P13V-1]|uniref:cob(I)yrinic acid a,c-diamide adenosyltransferase n=1 Tax=Sneathiella sp. P13V-1 TaxID=2697366 RepID=UPI00187BA354|nr:cob(I)yrinic acid a,c-diamide adenosyltransferase [Sneathiella sp. P13V-1]MBE7635633.1 cob(I)yrinic acid a,c-diamide adenosyltransferase [Sneathiella sp. P13V-1]
MVKLTKIYTRGGDKGQTSLGNGARVAKDDARVEAYGDVDELNAIVGVARLHTSELPDADAMLSRIQNDLFDLGADLCTPEEENPKYPPLRIVQDQVNRLEAEIDSLNSELSTLNSFILPGGSAASAHLHHARTVCRRAERRMVSLSEIENINSISISYINRLSDFLFVIGRYLNGKGTKDVLWVPGANR